MSGIVLPAEGLDRTKRWKKEEFSPSCLTAELRHQLSALSAPGSQASDLALTPPLPGPEAFGLRLNDVTGLARPSSYREQVVGLLSFNI